MEQLFQPALDFINIWGYLAILILMAMESACLPVPSELVFGFAGYLVFLGRMDFMSAVIAGVVGGLIGSIIAYGIGYFGGRKFVVKYGKYILLSQRHVDLAQKWFDRYGLKATFFSRLLPIVRTFISLPAGFARINFPLFVLYTILGSIPWTILLIYIGKLLGENWHEITKYGHMASLTVGVILLLVVVYYIKKNKVKN